MKEKPRCTLPVLPIRDDIAYPYYCTYIHSDAVEARIHETTNEPYEAMTAESRNSEQADPLLILRDYQRLSPWNLRDLSALCGGILARSGVRPINAAATERPNERTVRYYVTPGLVAPPEGTGTAAVYNYRHLLQVLFIKLRQMEGATLSSINEEVQGLTGDTIERRVASTLGNTLLPPGEFTALDDAPRGRTGRAFKETKRIELAERKLDDEGESVGSWLRLRVSSGIELHLSEDHPLARGEGDVGSVAERIKFVLNGLTRSNT